ncbi:Mitochondrial tRNAs modification protein [Microbotryomycetes sp. JL201]|nr:Mitochondrial tRNAs modification protein [Microbotryomycetes sp. JL201]
MSPLPYELAVLLSKSIPCSASYHGMQRVPLSTVALSAGRQGSALLGPVKRVTTRHASSTAQAKPISNRPRLVLGLESSADDSCAAVVSSERQVLSNIVIKQGQLLKQYGGIHPKHAQEAHQKNLPVAINRALAEAKVKLDDLDAIAFTRGPGMYGCLSTCAASAKALAAAANLPLIGVHHMQAHALTPFLTEEEPPQFPFLTLLLSGGHTLLLLAKATTSFRILATTRDESIGASLDKGSRELEIPLELGNGSAGAALEKFVAKGDSPLTFIPKAKADELFPVPFPNELAFSFSGPRSALSRALARQPLFTMSENDKRTLAGAFMKAVFKQIAQKVKLGIQLVETEERDPSGASGRQQLGCLVVSGGVASNMYLRQVLRETLDAQGYQSTRLVCPPPHLCTDNAAMIANVGLSRLERGRLDPFDVDLKSKWSIAECEADFEPVEGER